MRVDDRNDSNRGWSAHSESDIKLLANREQIRYINRETSLDARSGMMSVVQIPLGRAANGQFAKGISGNPAGRPKGSRNWATLLMEAVREGDATEIVDDAVARAKAGNVMLQKCFIMKLFPTPRHPAIQLEVPEGQEADPRALMRAALRAMAAGEITPEEALLAARALEKAAKLLFRQPQEGARRRPSGDAAKPPSRAAAPANRQYPAPAMDREASAMRPGSAPPQREPATSRNAGERTAPPARPPAAPPVNRQYLAARNGVPAEPPAAPSGGEAQERRPPDRVAA
jgi:hypothetical protein